MSNEHIGPVSEEHPHIEPPNGKNDVLSDSLSSKQSYHKQNPAVTEDADENQPKAFNGEDLEHGYDQEDGDVMTQASVTRTLSRRLTNYDEIYKEASNSGEPLPKMGGGKDYPPMLPDREPYAVAFDGPDDPLFPHNWPLRRKISMCVAVGLAALSVSIGSAMFSEASMELTQLFHIGPTTATLGTSLFVFGFASGPIVWGPISELYGRKIVMLLSNFGYICFCFMVGAAKDIQMIMICRFFCGFIGAAPLVVAPASIADLFSPKIRGQAMAIFASVLFGGPMLAPIFGGFTVKNPKLGWRWTSYFSGLVGVLALFAIVFFMDESHVGIILSRKAEVLRRRTGNWGIHASHEEISLSIKEICEKNITRPVKMLFTEPILFLITLYNAFIYGLLYLFLTAVPLIFQGRYGWSSGVAELPYLAMFIGVFLGAIMSVYLEGGYTKAMEKNNGKPVPEARLPPMMYGGCFFAAGLFWLGWSGDFPDKVHWIVPTISTAPIGIGLIMIFLPCINYIVDCYLLFAASALAGNTLLRSAFGAVFPLFARQMFTHMHIKWAGTLLGCVAVVLIPVPFGFYFYGHKIRAKSKYAFVL